MRARIQARDAVGAEGEVLDLDAEGVADGVAQGAGGADDAAFSGALDA